MKRDTSAACKKEKELIDTPSLTLEQRIERLLTSPHVPDDVKADLRYFIAHFEPMTDKKKE